MESRPRWQWIRHAVDEARRTLSNLPRHPLFAMALLGICLRLALMPYTSHPFDSYFFYRAAVDMLGGRDPYASGFYSYPPLFAYSYYLPTLLASLFASPPSMALAAAGLDEVAHATSMVAPAITGPAFNVALKTPILLADLAIGILLFTLGSKLKDVRRGKAAFALWFLNPLVIMAGPVAGHFDSIPAAFTLASLVLLLGRRNFLGGFTMGLGALYKAYPVFLGIAFLGLVVQGARRTPSPGKRNPVVKGALAYVAGGALAIATFMLPLALTRGPDLISRWATSFGVGGLSFWSLTKLPFFSHVPLILHRSQPGLQLSLLTAASFLSFSLAGFTAWRLSARRDVPVVYVLGLAITTLGALYLTLTTVNPQYLIWMLPFLVLITLIHSRARLLVVGLTIVGVGYYVSLQGPLAFLYPLAVFSPVLAVETLNASILAYWWQEAFSQKLVDLLLFGFGFVGFLLILISLVFGVALIRSDPDEQRSRVQQDESREGRIRVRRRRSVGHAAAVLGATAILLAVQVAVFASPPPGQASFGVESTQTVTTADGSPATQVSYFIHGGPTPLSLRIVAMHLTRLDVHRPVFYYYDANYPVVHLDPAGWRFLGSLIGSELNQRQYPQELEFVSATQLSQLLESGCDCIVILASTVLPALVFSREVNLLTPFLESGGTLVWIGDLIGGYVGFEGESTVEWDDPDNPQWEGEERILGSPIIHWASEAHQADIPTLSARALGLHFQPARVGAHLPDLIAFGGRAVGFVQNGTHPRSSISLVPVGDGVLVHFGSHARALQRALPLDLVARDVAQILIAGLAFSLPSPVFETVEVESSFRSGFLVPHPSGEIEPVGVAVYAFALNHQPFLSWFRVSPLPN